jgi:hypothetical protein
MKTTIFLILILLAFSFSVAAQNTNQQIPVEFISDGCTKFPDGDYYDCCFQHDLEYFAGGTWKERWRSDKKLFQCVAAKPGFKNKLIAPIMWLGVRTFGGSWLKAPFSWGFGKRLKGK